MISLLIASFTSGSIKDGFLGIATGAALVSFGQTIAEMKLKKKAEEQAEAEKELQELGSAFPEIPKAAV